MRVTVCVKPVPEDPGSGAGGAQARPDRSGRLVLDGADAAGVELALRLVEAAGAGQVTAVAMSPAPSPPALRMALAMGVHRAVTISDPALAGSDALATAKVLAALARRTPFDVVVAGTESADGSSGVVAAQLAGLLDLPAVTQARSAEPDGAGPLTALRIARHTATGWEEVVCPVPCVLTAAGAGLRPRYPSVRGLFTARERPWERPALADLGLAPATVGEAGARQRVVGVSLPPPRPAAEVVDDGGAGHRRILDYLRELGLAAP